MINFFRKLRQRFLTEKKLGRYLTYAAGEIILVVIGILIAVQVNNWNIQRKQVIKEKQYLSEIRKSLSQDLEEIHASLAYNLKKDSCINEAIVLLTLDIDNIERTFRFYELYGTLTNFVIFIKNDVAFKNMVTAESIALIRNDSLRKAISEYYQHDEEYSWGTQENTRNVTRQFAVDITPLLVSKELLSHFIGVDLDFKYPSASLNEFHKDPVVISKLALMKGNLMMQNTLLEETREDITRLLALLEDFE